MRCSGSPIPRCRSGSRCSRKPSHTSAQPSIQPRRGTTATGTTSKRSLSPAPLERIPLLVGGTGAHKTPYLAGRFADEFNVYPGPDMGRRIERFRSAALEAGRDPDATRLSSSGQVIAAATVEEFEDRMAEDAAAAGISREELEAHYEKRQTPRGTFEQVIERLAEFERLGISRFYFQGVFTPSDTGRLLDGLGVA